MKKQLYYEHKVGKSEENFTARAVVRSSKEDFIANFKGRVFTDLTPDQQEKELGIVYDECKKAVDAEDKPDVTTAPEIVGTPTDAGKGKGEDKPKK